MNIRHPRAGRALYPLGAACWGGEGPRAHGTVARGPGWAALAGLLGAGPRGVRAAGAGPRRRRASCWLSGRLQACERFAPELDKVML